MRLLYSEYKSDYPHYIFPYVIWAFPETGERPADFFARGFLPSRRELDRFYMCRHTRVELARFAPSSENRRILRKGEGLSCHLYTSEQFEYTDQWRTFCKAYADAKFGQDVMSYARLDSLFTAPVCSHVLVYSDEAAVDVGLVVFYLDQPDVAFYYYAFYDVNHVNKSLGMTMMTSSVALMKEKGFHYIYLGSCYSRTALYKSQFSGFQFWNGFRWSENIKELKYLIERDRGEVDKHLLETPDFIENFYPVGWT
ncbi:hypothetical protein EH223_17345 [candidate division KSB1 bacterium]|nr:hypothetical protein [candidate division KSB1 bacterium]RQW00913.1 MAG: hypothetical protein EH223_17345 [candidate division KSB1 bacterium]